MKIFYLGDMSPSSTSRHRANALARLGHEVIQEDPYEQFSALLSHPLLGQIHYHTGYRFLQAHLEHWLEGIFPRLNRTDCVWIDSGELFGAAVLRKLKVSCNPVILFNHDDPTGPRDRRRFSTLCSALYQYDLVTAVRDVTTHEMSAAGCKNVLRIWRTYDEIAHAPLLPSELKHSIFTSDVCFVGTWIRHEGRDRFLLELADAGINIAIWGARWQKSRYWKRIQPFWRGGSLAGQDYIAAIQGAKICLGMLSKGNRDLHTTRSMEIPFAGGLLCAKRTHEHLQLYKEGVEAVFWDDAKECYERCTELLASAEKREQIRLAGMERVRKNGVGNEDVCRKILTAVFG